MAQGCSKTPRMAHEGQAADQTEPTIMTRKRVYKKGSVFVAMPRSREKGPQPVRVTGLPHDLHPNDPK